MNYTLIKKFLIDYFRKGFLTLLITGLFLNLILKDHLWFLSGIYYLLPFKILLFISILYLSVSIKNKIHRILSILITILIVLILTLTGSGFIQSNQPAKLISWNIARDRTASEEIAGFVNRHESEIYIFIEFDKQKKKEAKKLNLNNLLPNYTIHRRSGNMAMMVKSEFEFTRLDSLNDRYNYFNIVEANGIKYAIVDIGSWPFKNRAKPFKMLDDLVLKYDVDIIAGDFNTPYNSVHFDALLQKYNCGNTDFRYHRETFPSCLPLVSLDNILISKRYLITKYQPEKNCLSDHFPLLLNYK